MKDGATHWRSQLEALRHSPRLRRRLMLALLTLCALVLSLILQYRYERSLQPIRDGERAASWRTAIKPAAQAAPGAGLKLQADSAQRLAAELVAQERTGLLLRQAQIRRAEGGRFELKGE